MGSTVQWAALGAAAGASGVLAGLAGAVAGFLLSKSVRNLATVDDEEFNALHGASHVAEIRDARSIVMSMVSCFSAVELFVTDLLAFQYDFATATLREMADLGAPDSLLGSLELLVKTLQQHAPRISITAGTPRRPVRAILPEGDSLSSIEAIALHSINSPHTVEQLPARADGDDAQSLFRSIVGEDRSNPRVLIQYSEALFTAGLYRECVAACDQVEVLCKSTDQVGKDELAALAVLAGMRKAACLQGRSGRSVSSDTGTREDPAHLHSDFAFSLGSDPGTCSQTEDITVTRMLTLKTAQSQALTGKVRRTTKSSGGRLSNTWTLKSPSVFNPLSGSFTSPHQRSSGSSPSGGLRLVKTAVSVLHAAVPSVCSGEESAEALEAAALSFSELALSAVRYERGQTLELGAQTFSAVWSHDGGSSSSTPSCSAQAACRTALALAARLGRDWTAVPMSTAKCTCADYATIGVASGTGMYGIVGDFSFRRAAAFGEPAVFARVLCEVPIKAPGGCSSSSSICCRITARTRQLLSNAQAQPIAALVCSLPLQQCEHAVQSRTVVFELTALDDRAAAAPPTATFGSTASSSHGTPVEEFDPFQRALAVQGAGRPLRVRIFSEGSSLPEFAYKGWALVDRELTPRQALVSPRRDSSVSGSPRALVSPRAQHSQAQNFSGPFVRNIIGATRLASSLAGALSGVEPDNMSQADGRRRPSWCGSLEHSPGWRPESHPDGINRSPIGAFSSQAVLTSPVLNSPMPGVPSGAALLSTQLTQAGSSNGSGHPSCDSKEGFRANDGAVYLLEEGEIGKGAFGAVRRCLHQEGRLYAGKMLPLPVQQLLAGRREYLVEKDADGRIGIKRDGRTRIKFVSKDSAAAKAGIQVDSEIVEVNGIPVQNIAVPAEQWPDVATLIREAPPKFTLLLVVPRQASTYREAFAAARDVVQEVIMLADLCCEYIVGLETCAVLREHVVMVMELCPGGSLLSVVNGFGRLPVATVVRYTSDMCKGLAYLHHREVAHRDFKTANVLLGNHGVCKLSDFGCSEHLTRLEQAAIGREDSCSLGRGESPLLGRSRRARAQPKRIIGTPLYLSPEAANCEPELASDIWSLGIVVCELLTGSPPYPLRVCHDPRAICVRLGQGVLLPTIPRQVTFLARRFLERCFQPNASDRPSAEDLLSAPFLMQTPYTDRIPTPDEISDGSSKPLNPGGAAAPAEDAPDYGARLPCWDSGVWAPVQAPSVGRCRSQLGEEDKELRESMLAMAERDEARAAELQRLALEEATKVPAVSHDDTSSEDDGRRNTIPSSHERTPVSVGDGGSPKVVEADAGALGQTGTSAPLAEPAALPDRRCPLPQPSRSSPLASSPQE